MAKTKGLDRIKRKLVGVGQLPTLPEVAAQVLRLARSPNSSMRDIARIVEKDPPMAARVLKVANSAYYGLSQKVSSLQHALAVLGLREVRNIVTSMGVMEAFPERGGCSFDRARFWEHSAACAAVANYVAEKMRFDVSGEAYVAGLLHDIGMLVLDQFFHEDYQEVWAALDGAGSLIKAEAAVLEATHTQVGALLAVWWQMHPSTVEVILHHHTPERASRYPVLTDVVSVADAVCCATGVGLEGDRDELEFWSSPSWKRLAGKAPVLEGIDLGGFAREVEDRIQRSREIVVSPRKLELLM